jgi:hypothetical protein
MNGDSHARMERVVPTITMMAVAPLDNPVPAAPILLHPETSRDHRPEQWKPPRMRGGFHQVMLEDSGIRQRSSGREREVARSRERSYPSQP